MARSENGNAGSSIFSVLLIVFVVLKLTGLIGWSWLWVLSPLWIPLAIVLIFSVVYLANIIFGSK